MDKIKKHLTAIIVFGINLVLVGVGFLFIKNSEEAKDKNAQADESVGEEAIVESTTGEEDISEAPTTSEPEDDVVEEKAGTETANIPAATAPIVAKPKTTNVPAPAPAPKSSAKTKTS